MHTGRMAKRPARIGTPPTSDDAEIENAAEGVDPGSVVDDDTLISTAATVRRDSGDDAHLVAELLKRAASKNKAALDKLAR